MSEPEQYTPSDVPNEQLSRTQSIISQLTHHNNHSQEELEKIITGHKSEIDELISRYSTKAGKLGPLESQIDDNEQIQPNKSSEIFNDADKWKYPLDEDTGIRLVQFVVDDPEDPRNWSKSYKWFLTVLLGIICFTVAFASAIVTGDISGPMESFHVSEEVIILTVTLFVIGFGVGPLVFAPLSEEVGRKLIYVTTLGLAVIFVIPSADAKNIGTLLISRLLSGIFFSAPMTLIGGNLAEMWKTEERGVAMSVFSAAPFLGPCVGPIVGGYIGETVGWRWIYWVLLIFSGAIFAIIVVLLPETHHQTLLLRRAKKLRKLTNDESYRALKEIKIRKLSEIAHETLTRPFVLLAEPIVALITIYMSILYGLLYMFFFAYPVVYMEGKGWSAGKTGLMFIPIAVGVLVATFISPLFNIDYNKRSKKYVERGENPPAELRLIPMMIGCWCIPIGLFAFAWSSYPHVSWAGPCFSGFICGVGFNMLYNPANNYIVDSYQHYAASALAAKTFLRSIWGACVPLFTIQMYHRLGYEWASSLLAFISLACCAIPYAFFFFGARIRQRSKYAYSETVTSKDDDEEKIGSEQSSN
ncbi:hypothetical protein WICMUC_003307 [Wickerhamomyces mucosus]|uniref:Major facilitator superfamily (MFS) profile domain-containing protein n=1 Tax=Wickerhamomyces mucosus TaxID=1378264 RepID=A0A9P8PN62_9ASCO|nr:hypothetical protein WICMUC_003307 [Wickerhamomyces mucosus]